jgi:hypothetical protein
MMQRWADQEDKENERFPKHNNNNNHSDKGQRNYSGSSRKRKPDDLVAAIERNLRGKKSGNQQDQFEKILHKQCLMHPKSRHTLFQCISLRNSLNAPLPDQDEKGLNAPLPDQDEKGKDKEDIEGDKSGVQGYQHSVNVIDIIFGGDGGFSTKRGSTTIVKAILGFTDSFIHEAASKTTLWQGLGRSQLWSPFC